MLLLALLAQFVATTPVGKSVITNDMNASVWLHIKIVDGDTGNKTGGKCSGTYIGPRTILTAAHCVEKSGIKYVWAKGINDTFGYPVKVTAIDRERDLALLIAPFKHSYVKLGDMPKRGDTVFNIGSPLNFEFVISEGIVSQTEYRNKSYGKAKYLVTTAMANPGSSGGGAFDKKGRLIGVNTMIIAFFGGWNGITMSVNVESIREFLRQVYMYYDPEVLDEI